LLLTACSSSGLTSVSDPLRILEAGDVDEQPDAGDGDAPLACVVDDTSSLPHVHVRFASSSCTFTVAEAAHGITIRYDLVVDQDVQGFVPARPYAYGSDAANLVLDELLQGGGQKYCVCDKGLPLPACPLADGGTYVPDASPDGRCAPVTIPAGVYPRTFTWDGRNWGGPSDTANPEGPPFPAGDYELSIATEPGAVGAASGLSATGRFRVRLEP
jgi:hypothetical protein